MGHWNFTPAHQWAQKDSKFFHFSIINDWLDSLNLWYSMKKGCTTSLFAHGKTPSIVFLNTTAQLSPHPHGHKEHLHTGLSHKPPLTESMSHRQCCRPASCPDWAIQHFLWSIAPLVMRNRSACGGQARTQSHIPSELLCSTCSKRFL